MAFYVWLYCQVDSINYEGGEYTYEFCDKVWYSFNTSQKNALRRICRM